MRRVEREVLEGRIKSAKTRSAVAEAVLVSRDSTDTDRRIAALMLGEFKVEIEALERRLYWWKRGSDTKSNF